MPSGCWCEGGVGLGQRAGRREAIAVDVHGAVDDAHLASPAGVPRSTAGRDAGAADAAAHQRADRGPATIRHTISSSARNNGQGRYSTHVLSERDQGRAQRADGSATGRRDRRRRSGEERSIVWWNSAPEGRRTWYDHLADAAVHDHSCSSPCLTFVAWYSSASRCARVIGPSCRSSAGRSGAAEGSGPSGRKTPVGLLPA